jgi:hypothetical protein
MMDKEHRKIVLECPPGTEAEALHIALDFLDHPEWHAPVARRQVVICRGESAYYDAWGYRHVVHVTQRPSVTPDPRDE